MAIDLPATRYARLRGLRYAWMESGAGPAVLFLHGFTGSKANWQEVMGRLPCRRLLALDLPGHGESETPDHPARCSMEQAAADLDTLCAALDLPALDVCGYSMGGRLALYFALVYPQRVQRLVLESASPGLESESERSARRLADVRLAEHLEQEGLPSFVEYWEKLPLFASQSRLPLEVRQRLHNQRMQNRPAGLANSLRGMGTGQQPSLWGRLAELQMPVLLLAGELDAKYAAINRRMAQSLPACRLVVAPEAGHTLHLEQPETFSQAVRQFLDSPAGGAASA